MVVPLPLFNFATTLLSEKGELQLIEDVQSWVLVNPTTNEKVLVLCQQLLHHVTAIPTPLGIATAYHLHNHKRSKVLINLNNRLGQGISNDSLQRQLTKETEDIMQQVEEDGLFISATMSHAHGTLHVFAMDNLDWQKMTLEGDSFNATAAIVIDNPETTSVQVRWADIISFSVQVGWADIISFSVSSGDAIPACHISAGNRRRFRSLSSIGNIISLETPSNDVAENILLNWHL